MFNMLPASRHPSTMARHPPLALALLTAALLTAVAACPHGVHDSSRSFVLNWV